MKPELLNDISVWITRIAQWIDLEGVPNILHTGFSHLGSATPPSKSIQLTYSRKGEHKELYLGDLCVHLKVGHIVLRNLHFGSYSRPFRTDSEAWGLTLDTSDAPRFSSLAKAPLFCSEPVADSETLIDAFEKIHFLCLDQARDPCKNPVGTRSLCDTTAQLQNDNARQLRLKGAILDLLGIIMTETGTGLDVQPYGMAVRKAISFIGQSYRRADLRLEHVAAAAGLGVGQFGRVFNAYLGTTPMQYVKGVRVGHAKLLLQESDLRIGEVAHTVGFSDPLHFSRVFKAETSLSPRAFRNA